MIEKTKGIISSMKINHNAKYVMTASEEERHIAIWNIFDPKRKKNKAIGLLSMEHPIVSMDTCSLQFELNKGKIQFKSLF